MSELLLTASLPVVYEIPDRL